MNIIKAFIALRGPPINVGVLSCVLLQYSSSEANESINKAHHEGIDHEREKASQPRVNTQITF